MNVNISTCDRSASGRSSGSILGLISLGEFMSTILIRFGHLAQRFKLDPDPLPGNRHLSSKPAALWTGQGATSKEIALQIVNHCFRSRSREQQKSQDSTCVHSFGPMSWPSSNILFCSLADKAQWFLWAGLRGLGSLGWASWFPAYSVFRFRASYDTSFRPVWSGAVLWHYCFCPGSS